MVTELSGSVNLKSENGSRHSEPKVDGMFESLVLYLMEFDGICGSREVAAAILPESG
jgi:hypothetical protein